MCGTRENQTGEANKSKAMSDDLKLTMGLIDSLYPGFKLKDWLAIADENRNSLATVKQRFPKTIEKYKEASQGDLSTLNITSIPVAAALRPPQAPVGVTQRDLKRTAPHEYEDEEHDDDSMPPPSPPKWARRSTQSITQSTTKDQTASGTDEDLYEANLLKYGGPRGWPVPVDDTFKEWIFPGEGRNEARENRLREEQELIDIRRREALAAVPSSPRKARSRLGRGHKQRDEPGKDDELQE